MGVREEIEQAAINKLRVDLGDYIKTMSAAGGSAMHQSPRISDFIGIMAVHQPDGDTHYQYVSFGTTDTQQLRDHESRGLVDLLREIVRL